MFWAIIREPINVQTHSASQNDHQNLGFMKNIYGYGKKMVRNGGKMVICESQILRLTLYVREMEFRIVLLHVFYDMYFQINDTHYHPPLKAKYRELEQKLMLEKLTKDKIKIPSTSRDEIINMVCEAMKSVSVDNEKAFKSLFITNKLDGSEDYEVSDKIMDLVGTPFKEFREKLMKEKSPRNLQELFKKITPPKGVHCKSRIEGMKLFDGDGDDILEDVNDEEVEHDKKIEKEDETEKHDGMLNYFASQLPNEIFEVRKVVKKA